MLFSDSIDHKWEQTRKPVLICIGICLVVLFEMSIPIDCMILQLLTEIKKLLLL